MKTDFSINVNVSIGVTPEVVALVTSILTKQPGQIVVPGVVSDTKPEEAAQTPVRKTRKAKGEAAAEAPVDQQEEETPVDQQEEETPADQPEPQPEAEAEANRELTEEDVREAMHKVRQRIEGENYKENTDSENYKKYHRVLTQTFKNISALLGSDKPSTLPADQRAAFINEINALVVNEKGEITKPNAF